MPRRHHPAKDEERYWRTRTILEYARVAIEILWDVLRRGGAIPF
jgi:hypothetical protein